MRKPEPIFSLTDVVMLVAGIAIFTAVALVPFVAFGVIKVGF